jgi:acetolactate synthase-1/2/3 large subunit
MESLPNFVKVAEAYGHVGMCIDDSETLHRDLGKALALTGQLVLVDVRIDHEEHVYPMQIRHGKIDDMWIGKGEKA